MEMKDLWNCIQIIFAVAGGWLGYYLGGLDSILYMLLTFMAADYVTGVLCAISNKKLSSQAGFKGICRKVLILLMVGIANVIDVQIIKSGSGMRSTVIFFYISNEGISILENAGKLGLPIPERLKSILEQIHDHDPDSKGRK